MHILFRAALGFVLASGTGLAAPPQTKTPVLPVFPESTKPPARVVIVHDALATEAFQPKPERVRGMVDRGITTLTGKHTTSEAWRSLISTQDIVGLKVYSSPGPNSGTRPEVVAAVVESLLEARVATNAIIVWDKDVDDLRNGGFFDLAARYHVRVQSSAGVGFDEATFYSPDEPILGKLIYGDLEFGRTGNGIGRKSFVSKLVSKTITKIINISPLLIHYRAGVSGNLYGLTMGSVDNTARFEEESERLAKAVPEIYALPSVGDRVMLNIVDALICQYEGARTTRLHDSVTLNELRFSTDPVALDVLSVQELSRQRVAAGLSGSTNRFEIFLNASELELGVSNPANIEIERVRE